MGASAQGDLARTPLPQILTFLLRKKQSGTLNISPPGDGGEIMVHFIQGQPAHVQGGKGVSRLGELLVIRGIIKAKTLASALRGMKEKGVMLGRYLLDEGLVQEKDLADAMRFQVEQKLTALYELAEASFTFHQGENLTPVEESEMYPLDAVAHMPRALREKWKPERIDAQLAKLQGHGLRVSGRGVGEPLWSEEEKEALGLLKIRVHTLDSALGVESYLEQPMRVVLYVLMLTSGLEFTQPPSEAAPPEKPRTAPSQATPTQERKQDPRLAAMRKQAQEKIAQIKDGDLFGALDVDESVSPEQIRKSYLALVKKFHPDRAAALDDPQLKEALVYISAKLREAADTLTDPALRRDYERARAGGPTRDEEEAIVQQTLAAELAFQKAGILARKKKWAETIEVMEHVVRADPENGDYLALLAWARASKGGPGADLSRFEADLKNAVSLSPKSEKANYYLAQVLKRVGKESEARKHLQTVASINPHNIEVKRELHIMARRQGQTRKPAGGGLFSGRQKGAKEEKDSSRKESASGEKDDGTTLGKLKKILTRKL